ncbi:T9SS type A sorting domain-containing protein [candidate division KSB1 bacterium]|nr:T9SS type A sorting domain-containing protein [candidate division KSB1 bacterium]
MNGNRQLTRFEYLILLLAILCQVAGAQTSTLDRPFEPVMLTGSTIAQAIGWPFDELAVCRYDASTQTWQRIAAQFDDVGSDESYFSENDGILDANDELVLMAGDAGDQAPAEHWIDDIESAFWPRLEIAVSNSTDPSQIGWVYLYRSSALAGQSTVDYVGWDGSAVSAAGYDLAHNGRPFLQQAAVTAANGGSGVDFIDREKIRVAGQLLGAPYVLTEDQLALSAEHYKDGPVRVLREMTVSLGTTTLMTEKAISERYYPYSSVTGGSIGTISTSYGVTYLRQSLDLNATASGMLFYSAGNTAVTIDGVADGGVQTTLPSSGLVWSAVTGAPGSMVQFVDLPALGNPQQLYYRDDAVGGVSDPVSAGGDTGDLISYGDIGVSFVDPSVGTYALGYTRYFLPANLSQSEILDQVQNRLEPLTPSTTEQLVQENGQIASRIVNARIESGHFLWDVEINRLNDWSITPVALADLQVSFVYNPLGFSSPIATIVDRAPFLVANANYSLSVHYSTVGANTVRVTWDPQGGGSDYFPPLNTWEPLLTLSLPIADPGQSADLFWDGVDTGFMHTGGQLLQSDLSGSGDIPLPIELLSFTAAPVAEGVLLEWSTASETENLGFWINRSRSVDGPFVRLNDGWVQGAGNSLQTRRYSLLDSENLVSGNTYYYQLVDVRFDGVRTAHPVCEVVFQSPQSFALEQNYPNPFNPQTTIAYQLAQDVQVSLIVHDLLGREVAVLVDDYQPAGNHSVIWQADSQPSGIYFYRLAAGEFTSVRRMVLRK